MNNKTSILAAACLIFFALGLMTAALGPVLPSLAEQTGSALEAVGAIFTAVFLGALAAQLAAGPAGDRLGMRWVLLGGMVLLAVGTLGISFSRSLPIALAFALLSGVGHGAVDLGANVLIATVFNGRSVSALNLLNVFFGIGAFAGPAIAGYAYSTMDTGVPALWISSALLVLALPVMGVLKIQRPQSAQTGPAQSHPSIARLYRTPLLYGLGMLILLYVGTENGVGGWTTSYVQQTTSWSLDQASLVAAGFWLALTAGRGLSALLGLKLSSTRLLAYSLAGASLGSLLLVLSSGNAVLTSAAVILIGLSFGPFYPTVIAMTTSIFAAEPGKAAGVVAAMGSIGGMLLPWLQGVVLAQVGPLACAVFTMTAALLMAAAAFGVLRTGKHKTVMLAS